MPETRIPTYEEDRLTITGAVWLVVFLIIFQFLLHYSQTRDLQRRVGQLEQQVKR